MAGGTIVLIVAVALAAFLLGAATAMALRGSQSPLGAVQHTVDELAPLPVEPKLTHGIVPEFAPVEMRAAGPDEVCVQDGKDIAEGEQFAAIPMRNARPGDYLALCTDHLEVARA